MTTNNSTEKEVVIGEVKSLTANEETVEAAKQILADVLTKAVDAIKEAPLLSATTASEPQEEKETFWTFKPNKTIIDEVVTDYIVKCDCDGDSFLLGQGSTFAKSIQSANGFASEKEALEAIKKIKDSNILAFNDAEVMMRTMKCQLNAIGHGE